MSQMLWAAMDDYFEAHLLEDDPILEAALANSQAAGLPEHQVSATQGKLLMLLAQMQGAKRILELGTLGGYSTIWLARALPADGQLISLEYDPKHAEVARKNMALAGFEAQVTILTGTARDSLARLEAEKTAPFDLIFIDADKPNNPHYFRSALNLSRPGTVIVLDNVVRNGAVLDANSDDASGQGVQAVMRLIAEETRVEATALQTVGNKGYDGFALLRVIA